MEESITTPDSGELPAAVIEPEWVTKAREEMAVLMADKQRMGGRPSQAAEET